MKNVIYDRIVKDIEKEKNLYIQKQLDLLLAKLDKVANLNHISLSTEDILIILSDQEDHLTTILEDTYDEQIKKDIPILQNYIEKYFTLVDYNGDLVNRGELSNGVLYSEFERDIMHRNKAMQSKNKVANIIKFVSVLFLIISFLIFFALITSENIFGIISLVVGGLSAILFYAIGEIIQILHDIRRKMYKD